MSGKGDKRRPRLADRKTFDDNWRNTFGEKPCKCLSPSLTAHCPKHGDCEDRWKQ